MLLDFFVQNPVDDHKVLSNGAKERLALVPLVHQDPTQLNELLEESADLISQLLSLRGFRQLCVAGLETLEVGFVFVHPGEKLRIAGIKILQHPHSGADHVDCHFVGGATELFYVGHFVHGFPGSAQSPIDHHHGEQAHQQNAGRPHNDFLLYGKTHIPPGKSDTDTQEIIETRRRELDLEFPPQTSGEPTCQWRGGNSKLSRLGIPFLYTGIFDFNFAFAHHHTPVALCVQAHIARAAMRG